MDILRKKWHRYHYKNLTYLALSLIFTFILLKNETFHGLLLHLGNYGYISAFIGGVLFVSTFTISIGSVMLLVIAETLHPVEIGIVAGMGAIFSDLTIFHFVRSRGLVEEVKHISGYLGGDRVSHLLHTKYFSWTLPVVGALIIASPLPDELGVGLIGISKMKTYQFVLLSFILNAVGIFLVVTASFVIKP